MLEEAGYADVGKTNLHEFAYGTTSENPHFGTVPNPAAPGRVAGGSSGGSAAALAAGLADAALGTDSGGSIRIPAACCGVVGFKPSYGLVSLDGCWPLAASYDHAGPMARDVETCTRMLEVLVPDFRRHELASLEGSVSASPGPSTQSRSSGRGSRRLRAGSPAGAASTCRCGRARPTSSGGRWRTCTASSTPRTGARMARTSRSGEACLRVTDAQFEQGLRERERYRERVAAAAEGSTSS